MTSNYHNCSNFSCKVSLLHLRTRHRCAALGTDGRAISWSRRLLGIYIIPVFDMLFPDQEVSTMRVIDSHTEGEANWMIIDGDSAMGNSPLAERVLHFAIDFDADRSFPVHETYGREVVVGALLCDPSNPACAAGLTYFNKVGYFGMCGH